MPGIRVRKRGGHWYAVGSVAGQRIRKSLGTRDERQAIELAAQYEAALWKRHSYGEEAVRTFEEAALSYMNADGEAEYLAPLIEHFRGRVLGTIKPEEIRAAARKIYPEGKPATRNRNVIVPARAVINHAAGRGWCHSIRVRSFPVEKVRRAAADRAWLDRFLGRADRDGLPHLAAAILFMWQTGVRVSEAARVMPEHLDLGKRQIVIEKTKTGAWRVRHITQELTVRLANLPLADDQPVFGYASRFGLYRRMRAVCRRAGLSWLPPHQAGRHSFATNALAAGATIKQVMEGGDWASAKMVLEIYAHAEDGGREIARLFDANRAQPKSKKAGKPASSRRRAH